MAAACCGPNPLTLDPCTTESSQMPALTSVQPPAAPVRANVAGTRSGALGMSLSPPDRGAGRSRQDCASPSVASALSLLIFFIFFFHLVYFGFIIVITLITQQEALGSARGSQWGAAPLYTCWVAPCEQPWHRMCQLVKPQAAVTNLCHGSSNSGA